jgi:hypothetical protein
LARQQKVELELEKKENEISYHYDSTRTLADSFSSSAFDGFTLDSELSPVVCDELSH